MKVAVLNYKGAVPSSVTGPYDILSKVNSLSETFRIKTRTRFDVDIVDAPSLFTGLSIVTGQVSLTTQKKYELIIIPAMFPEEIANVLHREQDLVGWVSRQFMNGSEVASICLGSFLLASTGLLDGKRATTHWMGSENFRQMFPLVHLEDEKVIIDEGRIYSCGAAYSFTSLIIYLIEKFCGREMALMISRVFMIQVHDSNQQTFAIFQLQRRHEDGTIKEIQEFVEKNYASPVTISELALRFHLSQRTLIRKFSKLTGNTPLEYLQRVRIEAAKKLLEEGNGPVENISCKVGYEDFHYFRKIFKRYSGITPMEYKRKYGSTFLRAALGTE